MHFIPFYRFMSLLCYCLFLGGLISCVNRNIHRELEEFSKKNIVVPHSIRQMVAGRDSVVLNPANGDARLVVWVDSVACSSCRLSRIHEYSEIVSFSNETRNAFAPVFVFSPPLSKIDEILLTLQISQFDYSVFIDERGSFSAANPHIPTDSRFHTFLLDRNGKVVLVGDPVNNPPLWELYKTTITQLIENDGTLPIVEK